MLGGSMVKRHLLLFARVRIGKWGDEMPRRRNPARHPESAPSSPPQSPKGEPGPAGSSVGAATDKRTVEVATDVVGLEGFVVERRLRPAVSERLKRGPEQVGTIGPIAELLLARGW